MSGNKTKLNTTEQLINLYNADPDNLDATEYNFSGIKLPTDNKPLMSKIIETMIQLSAINPDDVLVFGSSFLGTFGSEQKITQQAMLTLEQYNQLSVHALTCGDPAILDTLKRNFAKMREGLLEREEPQAKAFGKAILKLEVHVSLIDELLKKYPTLLSSLKEDAATSKNLEASYIKLREKAFNPTHILDLKLMQARNSARDLIKANTKDKLIDRALSFALGIFMLSQLDLIIIIPTLVMGFAMCTPNPAGTIRVIMSLVNSMLRLSAVSNIVTDIRGCITGTTTSFNPIPIVLLTASHSAEHLVFLYTKRRALEHEMTTINAFARKQGLTLKSQPGLEAFQHAHRKKVWKTLALDMICAALPEATLFLNLSPEWITGITKLLFWLDFSVSSVAALSRQSYGNLVLTLLFAYNYRNLPTGDSTCLEPTFQVLSGMNVVLLDNLLRCPHSRCRDLKLLGHPNVQEDTLCAKLLAGTEVTQEAVLARLNAMANSLQPEKHGQNTISEFFSAAQGMVPPSWGSYILSTVTEVRATPNGEVLDQQQTTTPFLISSAKQLRNPTQIHAHTRFISMMLKMRLQAIVQPQQPEHPKVELTS